MSDASGPEKARSEFSDRVSEAARMGPRLVLGKVVLLTLLAVGGALLFKIPAVRSFLAPAGWLTEWLLGFGGWAWPLFLVGSGLLITIGVPRLLFCPVAGAVFGFWGGLVITTVATMTAYFLSFLFLRGRFADRETPMELPDALSFLKHDPGMGGVILARLMPVPGLIATVALSLSPVKKRSFLMGSWIGLTPEAVPLIMLGAGLFQGNPKQLAWLGAGGLVLILALIYLLRRLLARYRH